MFLISGLMLLTAVISLFWDVRIFIGEAAAALIVAVLALLSMRGIQKDIQGMLAQTAKSLNATSRESLALFPLPVALVSAEGEITWYNEKFRDGVLGGKDAYGAYVSVLAQGISSPSLGGRGGSAEATVGGRKYTVYSTPAQNGRYFVLYWIDNTELKDTAVEYARSRPVVAIIMIDNYDELMQNAREGEKGDIVGAIEKQLIAWVASTTGFLRHSDRDKYVFIFEQRHFEKIVESRFSILDRVRQISVGDRMFATLSIGVGRGGTLAANEEMARQALDMALGRGGDQAAVKTQDGYDFYGGVSKAVEKRTKVKTRIIASALAELIDGSENVVIMGHRNADLDSLGACVGLYKAISYRGRYARIAINLKNCMVQDAVAALEKEGYREAFIEPESAMQMMTRRSTLIVVDTHRKAFVDSPELYAAARNVVVIDHHRKMVDYIDNAVIFHHEPYASSASEMVAELTQYLADEAITSVEADMLLAGISLDTRNFTVRTGVRTFEAAAYLKRRGADTARVKLLFSGSMENYRRRARLVASADVYRGCAIAVYDGEEEDGLRFVAPQAADELLTISGVKASIVVYPAGTGSAISARSMGEINVQLIVEKLGGGGHMTMAGAQLPGVSVAETKLRVREAVDRYFRENREPD
jgi:c-di-AMP phosphodiesterase-like protein